MEALSFYLEREGAKFALMNNRNLQQLQKVKRVEAGGLCWVDFVPVDWVVFHPGVDPFLGVQRGEVLLAAGREWLKLPVPDIRRGLVDVQQSSDAGEYVDSRVTGFLVGDTVRNAIMVKKMRRFRYIVVVRQPDGIRKILGTMKNPARVRIDYRTGEEATGTQGYDFAFEWKSNDGAEVYLGLPSENQDVESPCCPVISLGNGRCLGLVLSPGGVPQRVSPVYVGPAFDSGLIAMEK